MLLNKPATEDTLKYFSGMSRKLVHSTNICFTVSGLPSNEGMVTALFTLALWRRYPDTQWNKMQCKTEPDHSEEQSQRELCREVHQCEWYWRLTGAEESPPTRLLTADKMLCWTDREGDRDSWNRVKNTHCTDYWTLQTTMKMTKDI